MRIKIQNFVRFYFVFVILLVISIFFYPERYSIFENNISDLGIYYKNTPIGSIFFAFSMLFLGYTVLHFADYTFELTNEISEVYCHISRGIFKISSFTITAIGLVPDLHIKLFSIFHVFFSIFSFIIISLAAVIFHTIFIKTRYNVKRPKIFSVMHKQLYYIGGIFIIINIIIGIRGNFPGVGLMSFCFWEWLVLISFSLYMISVYYIKIEIKKY